jgi:hypothetical protein
MRTRFAATELRHGLRLHVTTPAPRDVWWELFQTDPDALPSQSPEWLDVLCVIRGAEDASILYQTQDGQRVVLPMVRRRHVPSHLTILESMPVAWGYGGPLTSSKVTPEVLTAVLDDLTTKVALRVHVRPNPLHGAAWAAAVGPGVMVLPRRAHVLDLSGGFDHVWSERFTKKARWEARRAERRGVSIECDTTGRLVPVFHTLLVQSFERWARQQHEPRLLARARGLRRDPLRKWQVIAERLGPACQVWVAWYQGQPAAAQIVLRGTNAHYTRGAMDKALAGPSQATSLLQKMAIEDACRAGCRTYHMGETGDSQSLAHFKARFGAVPYEYAEYRLERLPLTAADHALRQVAKRMIGFRDA